MTARSIFNFGHGRLRLVDARCEHCTGNAVGYASGAGEVLQEAGVFSSLALAVEDVAYVFAIVSTDSALGLEGRATEPISLGAAAAEAIRLSAEAGALSCAVVFGANEDDLRSLPTEPRRVPVGTHDESLALPQFVPSRALLRDGLAVLRSRMSSPHVQMCAYGAMRPSKVVRFARLVSIVSYEFWKKRDEDVWRRKRQRESLDAGAAGIWRGGKVLMPGLGGGWGVWVASK